MFENWSIVERELGVRKKSKIIPIFEYALFIDCCQLTLRKANVRGRAAIPDPTTKKRAYSFWTCLVFAKRCAGRNPRKAMENQVRETVADDFPFCLSLHHYHRCYHQQPFGLARSTWKENNTFCLIYCTSLIHLIQISEMVLPPPLVIFTEHLSNNWTSRR
jgi:hypothetical protein